MDHGHILPLELQNWVSSYKSTVHPEYSRLFGKVERPVWYCIRVQDVCYMTERPKAFV